MSSTAAATGGESGDLAYYQEQLSQVKALLDQDPENEEIKEIYEQLKDTVHILEESEKQKETVLAMGAEIEKERLAAAAALEAEKKAAAAPPTAASGSAQTSARSHLVGRTCEVFYENKWFNAEITGVRVDEIGTERCAVRFIGFDQRREYKVQDVALLKPPRPQEAPVGSTVQAIWSQDGLWYQCTVLEHTVKGYKVLFEEDPGQTPEEVSIDQIRLIPKAVETKKATAVAEKEYVTPGGYRIPEKYKIDPKVDSEASIDAKKRKIHQLKTQQREELKNKESKQAQNSWQKFAKKQAHRAHRLNYIQTSNVRKPIGK
ncbi:Survival of motor neuron--splicing factor 30 [Perkinsus chesapeaki]|uniref:Survival of motor neuron--splicing factor 30 n=1 Tax=Perkinsus chesapeaki TaxID=330153 RepID=A0A7J6LR90_PERCH|nr:Survival of motor neuron--splicing factor 30 [Perkinsus chesapeaki]